MSCSKLGLTNSFVTCSNHPDASDFWEIQEQSIHAKNGCAGSCAPTLHGQNASKGSSKEERIILSHSCKEQSVMAGESGQELGTSAGIKCLLPFSQCSVQNCSCSEQWCPHFVGLLTSVSPSNLEAHRRHVQRTVSMAILNAIKVTVNGTPPQCCVQDMVGMVFL